MSNKIEEDDFKWLLKEGANTLLGNPPFSDKSSSYSQGHPHQLSSSYESKEYSRIKQGIIYNKLRALLELSDDEKLFLVNLQKGEMKSNQTSASDDSKIVILHSNSNGNDSPGTEMSSKTSIDLEELLKDDDFLRRREAYISKDISLVKIKSALKGDEETQPKMVTFADKHTYIVYHKSSESIVNDPEEERFDDGEDDDAIEADVRIRAEMDHEMNRKDIVPIPLSYSPFPSHPFESISGGQPIKTQFYLNQLAPIPRSIAVSPFSAYSTKIGRKSQVMRQSSDEEIADAPRSRVRPVNSMALAKKRHLKEDKIASKKAESNFSDKGRKGLSTTNESRNASSKASKSISPSRNPGSIHKVTQKYPSRSLPVKQEPRSARTLQLQTIPESSEIQNDPFLANIIRSNLFNNNPDKSPSISTSTGSKLLKKVVQVERNALKNVKRPEKETSKTPNKGKSKAATPKGSKSKVKKPSRVPSKRSTRKVKSSKSRVGSTNKIRNKASSNLKSYNTPAYERDLNQSYLEEIPKRRSIRALDPSESLRIYRPPSKRISTPLSPEYGYKRATNSLQLSPLTSTPHVIPSFRSKPDKIPVPRVRMAPKNSMKVLPLLTPPKSRRKGPPQPPRMENCTAFPGTREWNDYWERFNMAITKYYKDMNEYSKTMESQHSKDLDRFSTQIESRRASELQIKKSVGLVSKPLGLEEHRPVNSVTALNGYVIQNYNNLECTISAQGKGISLNIDLSRYDKDKVKISTELNLLTIKVPSGRSRSLNTYKILKIGVPAKIQPTDLEIRMSGDIYTIKGP